LWAGWQRLHSAHSPEQLSPAQTRSGQEQPSPGHTSAGPAQPSAAQNIPGQAKSSPARAQTSTAQEQSSSTQRKAQSRPIQPGPDQARPGEAKSSPAQPRTAQPLDLSACTPGSNGYMRARCCCFQQRGLQQRGCLCAEGAQAFPLYDAVACPDTNSYNKEALYHKAHRSTL